MTKLEPVYINPDIGRVTDAINTLIDEVEALKAKAAVEVKKAPVKKAVKK